MTLSPQISVITVNYNGLEDTTALIASLRKVIHSCRVEIVVVDNGSRQDETQLLRQRFPDDEALTLIRSEQNRGFAGGNNLGFREAKAPWLFLLNNDTVVEEDHWESLLQFMEQHPQVGALSPKICFAFPPYAVQFAGYTPLSRITLRNALIGFGQTDGAAYATPHSTPYCHGAAMLVRREALERAGVMPECYFLYYEELDWSVRITEAGYTLWYLPSVTLFHKESQSTGQESPLRTYYLTRNRLWFAQRNRKGMERLLSWGYQFGVAIPKAILQHGVHRNGAGVRAVIRGAVDFLRGKDHKGDL
ncbi:MAG: glycosyltransferase family 2 protein [Alistipes sp.]|nr:glycosyltransferase family 2 protein [Alistipes sp.]